MIPRRRFLQTVTLLALGGFTSTACRPAEAATEPRRLRYVALGASDSVGVGANVPDRESWPAALNRKLPGSSQLINLGVSGSLIQQALEQQVPVAIDSDPDLITVWLAVNDYGARVPLPRYASDLDLLLKTLREQTRATILVGNVPDLSQLPVAARFDLRDIERWNNAIAELTSRHGAILVDLRAAWNEVAQHPEYISSDGFHPSTTGYQRLADLFYAAATGPLQLTMSTARPTS